MQARIMCLENEKARMITQLTAYKTRARSAVESANDRKIRDDAVIHVKKLIRKSKRSSRVLSKFKKDFFNAEFLLIRR